MIYSSYWTSLSIPSIVSQGEKLLSKTVVETSLVVQWIGICLPVQGTRTQSLVQRHSMCYGATKPMCHKYWVHALESTSHNCRAQVPQLLKPVCLEPVLCNENSHPSEKLLLATTREKPAPHKYQHRKKRNEWMSLKNCGHVSPLNFFTCMSKNINALLLSSQP